MGNDPDEQITGVLAAVERGEAGASADLLPLVYEHLRRLARARMAQIPPGNTLQPTALVHEAYLRVVKVPGQQWNGRGHFFAAAAEAMRRILVEQARRKASRKHGGKHERLDIDEIDGLEIAIDPPHEDMLDLDRALRSLEAIDRDKAGVVLLRYFGGLNREEIAESLGLSPRTVDRHWTFARAWLHRELDEDLA